MVSLSTPQVRVTRVTSDGDQVVAAACPAVVTISNELGDPRYPSAAAKVKARRIKPTVVQPSDLGLSPEDIAPRVMLTRQSSWSRGSSLRATFKGTSSSPGINARGPR